MAFIHGTVAGHTALYELLKTFLTTNADLVAADQNWDIVWRASDLEAPENASDVLLRGPGLAGQDQVYIGMRAVARPAQDSYYFEFSGATGPMASAQTYYDHIKSTPKPVRIFTDVGTIEYWIVANGRRFAMALKISTVFESMYAGLFLPYAAPLSYPYPLMIGGSAGAPDMGLSVNNWRHESQYHSAFVAPVAYLGAGGTVDANLWMLDPNGDWVRSDGNPNNGVSLHPYGAGEDYWQPSAYDLSSYSTRIISSLMTEAYGGGRLLTPYTLVRRTPTDQTYGVLDGIFQVSGVANAAENIIQSDGIDHMVVQNVFRTSFYDYFAMALE